MTIKNKDFGHAFMQINNFKILLVEDDKTCQHVIQNFLRGTGCALDFADTAVRVRELLHEFEYDLIFMDIGLPDGDGIELTKEIRQKMRLKTPIIATTAHISKERKDECIAAGINEYISKPIEAAAIKKIILGWAEKKN